MRWILLVIAFYMTLLMCSIVFAEPLPIQRVMLTDVGKIVLEDTPCPLAKNHNFEWKAYATDNDGAHTGDAKVHEGCWSRDQKIVSIWFYNEQPPLIATYHEMYFKDGNAGQVTESEIK